MTDFIIIIIIIIIKGNVDTLFLLAQIVWLVVTGDSKTAIWTKRHSHEILYLRQNFTSKKTCKGH